MFSGLFKLDWRDLVKGLVVCTLTALFYGLIQLLPSLGLPPLVQTIISTVLAYLAKNLVTDEQGKLGGKL